MKKFMALCLTIIMVIGTFTVAVSAATITVPASTLFDDSFLALEQIPDGYTIAGKKDTNYSFIDGGITALLSKNGGMIQIYKDNMYNVGNADYTFSVKFSHYDGTQYIHFGAQSINDAKNNGVSNTGYTFTATHYNTTADQGTYNFKGKYALYKNGEKIADLTDKGSVWAYQGVREFKFYVTSEGIVASGAVTETTIEDASPIKNGYVGAYMQINSGTATNLKLTSMKLTTDEYSYTVDNSQTTTGGYATWTKEGTNYIDFATSTALSQEQVWSSDSVTVGADETLNIVLKNKGMFYNNAATINLFGFTISKSGNTSAKMTLKQGDVQFGETVTINTADTTIFPSSNWSGYIGAVVTLYVTITPSTISLNINDTLDVWKDVPYTSPRTNTSAVTFSSASSDASYRHITGLTVDSADTAVVANNFLLDRSFSNANGVTKESLIEEGFEITSGDINEEGISQVNMPKVSYNKAFGGSYTIETKVKGNYENAATITFNKTSNGDYYQLKANNGDKTWTLVKNQNDALTEVVKSSASKSSTRKYNIILTSTEESLNIVFKVNDTELLNYTDENPITDAGTITVASEYNLDSTIYYLKVYPGVTEPKYTVNFLVNGTTSNDKGDIIITFPVVMLGQSPQVIAALYEDDKMTDIKMVNIDTLNEEGYARLFDTTTSKATDINVKVFIWNSVAGMIPVTSAFTLNN